VAGRCSSERPDDAGDAVLLQALGQQEQEQQGARDAVAAAVAGGSTDERPLLQRQLDSLSPPSGTTTTPINSRKEHHEKTRQQRNNLKEHHEKKRRQRDNEARVLLSTPAPARFTALKRRFQNRKKRAPPAPPQSAVTPGSGPSTPPAPPAAAADSEQRNITRVQWGLAAKPGDIVLVEGNHDTEDYILFKVTSRAEPLLSHEQAAKVRCETYEAARFEKSDIVLRGHYLELFEGSEDTYYVSPLNGVIHAMWVRSPEPIELQEVEVEVISWKGKKRCKDVERGLKASEQQMHDFKLLTVSTED
jgi:hypothetical protein